MAHRVGLCVAGVVVAIVSTAWAGATGDDEIAVLIRQLGDADYGRRERAAARLDEIGAAAIDQLLTAAEVHDDLEVSLRAGWLADSIPMTTAGDASEAAALLEGYKSKSLGDRIRIMHQLLRLDDDAGIVPLARIGRLDRDPVAARVAAALLVREWSPGDPSWPAIGERIMAGIGGSSRPVARLLASVVAFSGTGSSADRDRSLETAREMVAVLDRGRPTEADVAGDDLETDAAPAAIKRDIGRTTQQIFERCLATMLAEAGRREEAVAVVRKELEAAIERKGDAVAIVAGVADALIWAAAHGLPAVVDGLSADRAEGPLDHQVIAYARAICERARQQDAVAERIARAAFETDGATFTDRRQTGALLVKWGAGDWAAREFTAVVDDEEAAPAERVATSILYSEFLHDRGRDDEAAGERAEAERIRALRREFADLHQEAWNAPGDAAVRRRLAARAAELGRPDLERVWLDAAEAIESGRP